MNRTGKALVVVLAVLGLYVLVEGAGRLAWHHHLLSVRLESIRSGCSATDGPLYQLDQTTGYGYVPGAHVHLTLYDRNNHPLRTNNVYVNNHGHLALQPDSLEKSPNEFRIAIIGDSFTATTPSDVTWPTLLEDVLNQDASLRKMLGEIRFKVINFGLDGTGIVQWPAVYRDKVMASHPDLVVVNFIGNDIFREFLYRNTVLIGTRDQAVITCTSLPATLANGDCRSAYFYTLPSGLHPAEDLTRLKHEMADELIRRLPWFTPVPQLPGIVLQGRLGITSKLVPGNGGTPQFRDSTQAMSASRMALETIASAQPALLILYHPVLEECLSGRAPSAVVRLMTEERNLGIENMLEFLPLSAGQDEIRKWYNVPLDQHPSDYGARVYARAVAGRVSNYLLHTHHPAVSR